MKRLVTTTHLEMMTPDSLVAAPATELRVTEATIPSPELNRFLYTAVGGDWYWIDRLSWSYADWLAYLSRDEVRTWVAFDGGNPAGYFELERQEQGNVEIVYFGLLSGFQGQGHGGFLLTRAVEEAWAMECRRVWVHTCTLDGPAALRNYQRRGFTVFETESEEVELATEPPGPWPGARDADG